MHIKPRTTAVTHPCIPGVRSGIAQCSGSLIGAQRQHVLTAGHCLIDSSSSSDNVDKITFYPGLSGSDAPFSSLTAVKVRVQSSRWQIAWLIAPHTHGAQLPGKLG